MHCTVMADAYGQHCLPHTGLDVLPIFLAGIVLLAIGLAAYYATRPKSGWPPVKH